MENAIKHLLFELHDSGHIGCVITDEEIQKVKRLVAMYYELGKRDGRKDESERGRALLSAALGSIREEYLKQTEPEDKSTEEETGRI